MHIKSGLVVLGAAATLLLVNGNTAQAKSAKTEKNDETKTVKVHKGDTLSSIAKKHHTTYVRLFNANKAVSDPNTINVGDKIRIPAKKEKLKNRFATFITMKAPTASALIAAQSVTTTQPQAPSSDVRISYSGSTNGNTYAWGNCTWYVKNRRADLPNMLGNGGSWSASAAAQGFKTGSTPKAGAVAEESGHVAYVESVNKNGTITVSEMNYGGGLGQVHKRTVPASTFHYIY